MNKHLTGFVNEVNSFTPCKDDQHLRRLTFLIGEITRRSKVLFPNQIWLVLAAIWLCARHHEGQYRKAKGVHGGPYIIHPLESALILLIIGVTNLETILIAILHDTRENTKHGKRESSEEIWLLLQNQIVSRGVMLCTKPKGHKNLHGTLSKHIASKHWQSLLAKVAERTDNLKSLNVFPLKKQKRKLRETHRYFWKMCDVAEEEIRVLVSRKKLPYRYLSIVPNLRKLLARCLKPYEDIELTSKRWS